MAVIVDVRQNCSGTINIENSISMLLLTTWLLSVFAFLQTDFAATAAMRSFLIQKTANWFGSVYCLLVIHFRWQMLKITNASINCQEKRFILYEDTGKTLQSAWVFVSLWLMCSLIGPVGDTWFRVFFAKLIMMCLMFSTINTIWICEQYNSLHKRSLLPT